MKHFKIHYPLKNLKHLFMHSLTELILVHLLATFLLLIATTFLTYSQPPNEFNCGIEERLAKIYSNPELLEQYEKNKRPITQSNLLALSMLECTPATRVDVPLAFHFDNTFSCADASCILTEIQDVITTLNQNFADNRNSQNAVNCTAAYPDISSGTCVNFYLAAPPECSGLEATTDAAITIGQFVGSWSAGGNGAGVCWDDYLNVFIQGVNGHLGQNSSTGVSDQIPGYLDADGIGEGITIRADAFGGIGNSCGIFDTNVARSEGGTVAHEVGHYLSLPHIWGDVNGGGCEGDDGFSDTPNQARHFRGCPDDCIDSGCDGVQQTANFMNYTNDLCKDVFSEQQAMAMWDCAQTIFGHLNIREVSLDNPIICRGCTDPCAPNFEELAFFDDNSCSNYSTGCNDNDCNTEDSYDFVNCSCVNIPLQEPDCDDNNCNTDDIYDRDNCNCIYVPIVPLLCDQDPCTNNGIYIYDYNSCMCLLEESTAPGCIDENACNYNPIANCDDGSCDYGLATCEDPCKPITGCMQPVSINYNPDACVDDGSCRYPNQPIFYPQPAQSTVTIAIDNNMLGADITISNIRGEIMPVRFQGSTNNNIFSLDISIYEPGIYYFTAVKGDNRVNGSFIKA